MKSLTVCAVALMTLGFLGCGGGAPEPGATEADQAAGPSPPQVTELDPDDPNLIVRPFTAEQIREEMVPGLRVLVRRSYPEETRVERWTVLAADEESVEIEYATISDDGSVVGEPSVTRSTWVELRDHASFPAAHSTRRWISRPTQLGEFGGWLYRVADPEKATIQEFFFVPSLPGAPVHVRAVEGEATVFEMEQMARLRPEQGS